MTERKNWVWMPHAAHFICGSECRFHLATFVGDFIVSTVGELFPDESVRRIHWETRFPGIQLGKGDEGRSQFIRDNGWVELGYKRTYETMVFRSLARPPAGCCLYEGDFSAGELEMQGYNDPGEATAGHLKLCEKWSELTADSIPQEEECSL